MRIFWATLSQTTPPSYFTSIGLRHYRIQELGPHQFRVTISHAEDRRQVFKTDDFRSLNSARDWATQDIHQVRQHQPRRKSIAPPRAMLANAHVNASGARVAVLNGAPAK